MQKPTLPEATQEAEAGALSPSRGPIWVVGACPSEPHRLGEVLLLPSGTPGPYRVFGRGGAEPDDPHPRVQLVKDRPDGVRGGTELSLDTVSRRQLLLRVRDERSVEVKNLGRIPLTINGERTTEGTVHAGDVVEIGRQLLFVCASREAQPRAPGEVVAAVPFGGADPSHIVGESPAAWRLRARIAFVARQAGHVLITGASGTGKELVARAIHALSARAAAPFVARSAATLPEGLVDAELFGNVKNYPHAGASERPGLVGRAHGGTLFLDEIGELPPELQAHLLRLLDGGEYHALGEARTRVADLRLVAATNREAEHLKHDLLSRLSLRITVPPLDERREDIPLIARHILRRLATKSTDVARWLSPSPDGGEPRWSFGFVRMLVQHAYTTHVRELERLLLESAEASQGDTLTNESALDRSSAPRGGNLPAAGANPTGTPLLTPERIQACLDENNGALEPTALALGLKNRHVLSRLIAKHGLEVRRRSRR